MSAIFLQRLHLCDHEFITFRKVLRKRIVCGQTHSRIDENCAAINSLRATTACLPPRAEECSFLMPIGIDCWYSGEMGQSEEQQPAIRGSEFISIATIYHHKFRRVRENSVVFFARTGHARYSKWHGIQLSES